MKFFPKRIFLQLSMANILLGIFAILVTAMLTRTYVKKYFYQSLNENIRDNLTNLKTTFESLPLSPLDWCQNLRQKNLSTSSAPYSRYTIIDLKGVVWCDTEEDITKLDNHSDRPEWREAIQNGYAEKIRFGHTQQKKSLYGAQLIRLPVVEKTSGLQEFILRESIPMAPFQASFRKIDQSLGLFLIPFFILLSILSLWRGLYLIRPLTTLLQKAHLLEKEMRGKDKISPAEVEKTDHREDNEWDIMSHAFSDAYIKIRKQNQSLTQEKLKLSTLIHSLTDPIAFIDQHQKILYYNPPFAQQFLSQHLKNKNELEIWQVFRSKKILHAIEAALTEVSSKKVSSYHLSQGIKRNNQKDLYFDILINPINNSQNEKEKTQGAVLYFHNITSHKLAEQLRADFVANVSHEVRTPLTTIQGYVEILLSQKSELSSSHQQYLEKVGKNVNRVVNLFQDVLTLSLIESDSKLMIEEVDAHHLVEEVVHNFMMIYAEKNHQVDLHIKKPLIHVDVNCFTQILNNLLENAFKYVAAHGKIEVSLLPSEKHGLTLEVKDNGPGMSEDDQKRIFERFYRGDFAKEHHTPGTGLGLSIVKHAVLKHRGQVWVESTLGEGTSFHVVIPHLANS